MNRKTQIRLVMISLFFATAAQAAGLLEQRLTEDLTSKFPGAKIILQGEVKWNLSQDQDPGTLIRITHVIETAKGSAHFEAMTQLGSGEQRVVTGWVPFAAMMQTKIALRRIQPGEKIDPDSIGIQNLDLSQGTLHELRGLLFSANQKLDGLEARQTIMEGQPLLTSAVQRSPDLKRGEPVLIKILSGDLTLSVQGVAEEPGYMNGSVRVISGKSKKEFLGKLVSAGNVEVKL